VAGTSRASSTRASRASAAVRLDPADAEVAANVLYQAVVTGGLDPRDCTFAYGDAGTRITHLPSASYFLLEGDISGYTAKAVVGESQKWPFGLQTFWVQVEDRVRGWAEDVTADVDTPDLWAEVQRDREILTGARYEGVENTPFTADEQASIAEHLRRTSEYMARTYRFPRRRSSASRRDLTTSQPLPGAWVARIGRSWFAARCSGRLSRGPCPQKLCRTF